MRTYLECIPCFFKQALEAGRLAGANKKTLKKILSKLVKIIDSFPLSASPPEMGATIHKLVKEAADKEDPYRKIKDESNKRALAIYPKLKKKLDYSKDRLLMAVEMAIAGNIIDYGVKNSLDVDKELKRILTEEKKAIKRENKRLFNYPVFKSSLKKAKTILYLGDNSGEIVFDRILIEEIKRLNKNNKVIFAVKEKPIINDALAEDAKKCGLEKIATIVSNGLDAPGTILSLCSKEFLEIFKQADMIISKGQGNFESLSDTKKPIFFLFMAKCPVVCQDVSCNLDDIILLYNLDRTK